MARRDRNARGPWASQDGVSLVEYTLMLAFMAAACFTAVSLLGNSIASFFRSLVGQLG